jgi:hypothetical protein
VRSVLRSTEIRAPGTYRTGGGYEVERAGREHDCHEPANRENKQGDFDGTEQHPFVEGVDQPGHRILDSVHPFAGVNQPPPANGGTKQLIEQANHARRARAAGFPCYWPVLSASASRLC